MSTYINIRRKIFTWGWEQVVVSTTNSGSTIISWVGPAPVSWATVLVNDSWLVCWECQDGSSVIVVREGSLWQCLCTFGTFLDVPEELRQVIFGLILRTGSGEGVDIRSVCTNGIIWKKYKNNNLIINNNGKYIFWLT